MNRIAILADQPERVRHWTGKLAAAGSLEILPLTSTRIDVLVAIQLAIDDLPGEGPPIVLLLDGGDGSLPQGVHARLPVHTSMEELTAVIAAAAHGFSVLTESQRDRFLRRSGRSRPGQDDLPPEPLTARELQVLRLLADGAGNKEIAFRLAISGHTAKFHVGQILAKLNSSSRAEAVGKAMRLGLVPI